MSEVRIKIFYGVHLHGSGAPLRLFATEDEAIGWARDRDSNYKIQECEVQYRPLQSQS